VSHESVRLIGVRALERVQTAVKNGVAAIETLVPPAGWLTPRARPVVIYAQPRPGRSAGHGLPTLRDGIAPHRDQLLCVRFERLGRRFDCRIDVGRLDGSRSTWPSRPRAGVVGFSVAVVPARSSRIGALIFTLACVT
jgi:hypothetical protein